MKYELDHREAMEAMEDQEKLRQLETSPPRLERQDAGETGAPPRLDRAEERLGSTVMEMQLEMHKAEHERLKDQLEDARLGGSATELMLEMSKMRLEQAQAELASKQAAMNGYEESLKTPEYYQQKMEAIQNERDALQRSRILDIHTNYGIPDTEEYWQNEAADDFIRWGKETPYYNFCMKQAAEAHAKGK